MSEGMTQMRDVRMGSRDTASHSSHRLLAGYYGELPAQCYLALWGSMQPVSLQCLPALEGLVVKLALAKL